MFSEINLIALRKSHSIHLAEIGEIHEAFAEKTQIIRLTEGGAINHRTVDKGGDLESRARLSIFRLYEVMLSRATNLCFGRASSIMLGLR